MMSAKINVYLHFDGKCREAMHFYQECLGGELTMVSVEDSPMATQWPASAQKNILHASLLKDALCLLGSDMADSDQVYSGNSVSLSLTCTNVNEMEEYFVRLATGAVSAHPIHDFYQGKIGALTDRFGVSWMFFCETTGAN